METTRSLAGLSLVLCLVAPGAWRAAAASGPTAALRQDLDGWTRRAGAGTLLLRRGTGLDPGPLLETRVSMAITGPLARATVRQRFLNPGDAWAEGVYVFPLPDDAAVDHLRVVTGVRVIEGQIQAREEARRTYERAREEGRHAGLVEQERPNVFTASVANIPPGSEVAVEIEYQQSVRLDAGQFSVRFPTVVAPRYIPGLPVGEAGGVGLGVGPDTDRVPDASRVTPPLRPPGDDPIPNLEIQVDLAAGFEVDRLESPYHRIRVRAHGAGLRVSLAAGAVPSDRDFELRWSPRPGAAPRVALFAEERDGEHYTLLMVTPPVGPVRDPDPPPREVVYVIDTSGSMAGASLGQARAALAQALRRLRPDDHFNLIEFSDSARALFPESAPASPRNVGRALRAVERLAARGGTHVLPAIRRALTGAVRRRAQVRQVVFLTDGCVGNEDEIFEAIRSEVGESRLYAIAIGSAPNGHLMRRIAELGRGSFTHIGRPDEVAERMTALFRKLESVVLTGIELGLPAGVRVQAHPDPVPDLHLGEPVSLVLKSDAPLDWVDVSGRIGGTAWQVRARPGDGEPRPGVHALWARRRIAALVDARIGEPDARVREALRDEAVAVALEHHLVSAWTSLVAVDVTPERRSYEKLATHVLPTELPAGWSRTAVLGVGQGATSAGLHLRLGVLLLSLAWLARHLRGRP